MSETKIEKGPKLAIIRIRGSITLSKDVKDTLAMLNLHKQNFCSVFDNSPTIKGMLNKVKDFVTWGEINEETLKLLTKPEGKKFYRLSPPRKGFGRKGIKVHFNKGGALGNRSEKINDLITRMV